MVRPEVIDELTCDVKIKPGGNWWLLASRKVFSTGTTNSDRHPDGFFPAAFFASGQTQLTERDGEVHTEHTSCGVAQRAFARVHMTAHSVAQKLSCGVGKARVMHIARSHLVFDVLAQHPVCSFSRHSTRHPVPHHQGSQRPFRTEREVGAEAQARPLAGVSLAEWPTQPQTQCVPPHLTGVKGKQKADRRANLPSVARALAEENHQ